MGQWDKMLSNAAIPRVDPCDPIRDVVRADADDQWSARYDFLRKLDKGLSTTDFSDPRDCPKLYKE